ncbi:FHA domain-containing protein, partial [Microbacterium sp. AGC62]
ASAAAAPTPAPADDDLEETRISIPGHRLVFTWDDGTRIPVSRRTVFGRNPAPEEGVVVVPVRDETLSLSKTHFEAAAETSGGWILDRHSTNGLTLVREGQRISCPAGQRVPIKLGDVIEIGDRVVMVGGYA